MAGFFIGVNMCKQCEDCSKEHQYDGLAGVDFIEANEFI